MSNNRMVIQKSVTTSLQPGSMIDYDDGPASYVAEGVIGAIYRTSFNRKDYVVKVPHTPENAQKLSEEYDVISTLWQALRSEGHVPVPEIARGIQRSGGFLLIMPFYERPLADEIQEMLKPDTLALARAERLAVLAAIDFVRTMQVVREDCHKSCTDRKVKDFFLNDSDRLVVIDWNVLTDANKQFFAAELLLFGQLWLQLFLQRIGTPPNPLDDSEWMPYINSALQGGMPSIGLRTILAAAADPDEKKRFMKDGVPGYHLLHEALNKWNDLLRQPVYQLEQNKSHVIEQIRGLLPVSHVLERQHINAIWADLVWRLEPTEERWAARLEALKNEFGDDTLNALNAHNRPIWKYLSEDDDTFGALDYTQKKLQSETDVLASQHLRRWEILLYALDTARQKLEQKWGTSQSITFVRDLQGNALRVGLALNNNPRQDRWESLIETRNLLEDFTTQIQHDLTNNAGSKTILQQLEEVASEIEVRIAALDCREKPDPIEHYYVRKEQQPRIESISYLQDPDYLEPTTLSLQRSIFEKYLVNDFMIALEHGEKSQAGNIYNLAVSLGQIPRDVWPPHGLKPIVDALNFIQRHDDGDLDRVPLNALLAHVIDLRTDALIQDNPYLYGKLYEVALFHIGLVYRQVNLAVENKHIGALQEAYSAFERLDAAQTLIAQLMQQTRSKQSLENSDYDTLEEIDIVLERYKTLKQLHDRWLAVVSDYQIENLSSFYNQLLTKHDQFQLSTTLDLDKWLGFVKLVINLIDQSKKIGWTMTDIMGDERAIENLVVALQEAAANMTRIYEQDFMALQKRVNGHEVQVDELKQQLISVRQTDSFRPTSLSTRETESDLRELKNKYDTLSRRAASMTDVEQSANGIKSQIEENYGKLSKELFRLEQMDTYLNEQITQLREHLDNLIKAEQELVMRHIRSVVSVRATDDSEYITGIGELIVSMRHCSVACFAGIHEEWDRVFQGLVKKLEIVERIQNNESRAFRRKKVDPASPQENRTGSFVELLEQAANADRRLQTFPYWYEFAQAKYHKSQPIDEQAPTYTRPSVPSFQG